MLSRFLNKLDMCLGRCLCFVDMSSVFCIIFRFLDYC